MVFEVTQEDIRTGIPGSPTKCAVGRCINRYRKDDSIQAGCTRERAVLDGKEYRLPLEVTTRIEEFDRSGQMEPFAFELPVCP